MATSYLVITQLVSTGKSHETFSSYIQHSAAYITGFSVNQEFCMVIGVCKNVKENQHSKINRKETNRNKKCQKQLQEPKKS